MKPATQLNVLNFHLLTALGLSNESAEAVMDRISDLEAEVAKLRAALLEIEKGEGAFSRDQLKHADNVIENSKRIARSALQIHIPDKPNHHPMSSVDCRPGNETRVNAAGDIE